MPPLSVSGYLLLGRHLLSLLLVVNYFRASTPSRMLCGAMLETISPVLAIILGVSILERYCSSHVSLLSLYLSFSLPLFPTHAALHT